MDTFSLIAAERLRLADELQDLADDDWDRPSLCGEWTNGEVLAHLDVPFTMGVVGFLTGIVKAAGSFDRANARFAIDLADRTDPDACIEILRANAAHRFTPPGFGPEAPLTDVIVHGIDILQPLGRSVAVAPEALAVSLPFLLTRKAGRGFGAVRSDDLRLEPDDLDLPLGEGDHLVQGPALAMAGALAGRAACVAQLQGPGADLLRVRA
ncbi:maleylpyruvate isomerase family mycothiol-dependent enzyme [Aquihabitans sp. McL0605]|uniref:maleylpyruvate isomerase family mycothiol-dependent enzyme n=1 Tax=Aquihabitans sp. McL0605 TaxID=3415671 RepID=UPI003CFA9246